MDQNGESAENMWESPSSLLTVSAPEVGNDDIIGIEYEDSITLLAANNTMGDTIRVASPSLPSLSLDCDLSQSYKTNPEDMDNFSPVSSSSSLSDPPTEPNSPILFDSIKVKLETVEETGVNLAVADYTPLPSPTISRTPTSRRGRPRANGDRKPDPCADPVWVTAIKVANAADQKSGLTDGLTITGTRNLRRTSGRLNRENYMASNSSPSSRSLDGTPTESKKRSRLRTQLNNVPLVDDLIAIKNEILEDAETGMESYTPISSSGKKRGRPLGKKKNLGFAPAIVSELADSPHIDERGGKPFGSVVGETVISKNRKKRLRTHAYVTEVLGGHEAERTRASVPPSFNFRYTILHSPFEINKEPLRSSRYWSEGPQNPGIFEPIGGVFERKDGLLTDAVCITGSRLRPRKLKNSKIKDEPGIEWDTSMQSPKVTRKRTFGERDSETEESDGDLTATEDDYDDDETDDDLEIDSEGISPKIEMEEDNHDQGNGTLKRQKLNSGESFSRNLSGKRPNKSSGKPKLAPITKREEVDYRMWPGAVSFVNGKFVVPKCCISCKELRQFCDRNSPCANCTSRGKDCHRPPGLQPARRYVRRGKNRGLDVDGNSIIYPEPPQLDEVFGLLSLQQQPKRRGRPFKCLPDDTLSPTLKSRRLWVKKEVMNKLKKERDIQEVSIINLIDPQAGKPPGIRKPEVWCESRQELCESLPYYRSYQSGCYGHDGLIHGYLLDGFAAPRDYVDGKVVISHSGGKSIADEDGQRRLLTNQTSEDKVIKYLLSNMKNRLPVVMIMGTQCTSSPSKLPHRYCVMDWFKVTAGWAERDPRSGYTRWKFRFEKLDSTIDGWWAAAPAVEYDTPTEMITAVCVSCKAHSPHVYAEGWMCLEPECERFWTLDGKDVPVDLKYTDNFLRCRTPWGPEFLTEPSPLGPPLNFSRDIFFDGGDVSRVFWKGMCCPKCGRLNCREVWAGWRCISCDFKFDPPRTIFDATRLADPHRPVFTGPAIPSNICHDDITYERYIKDGMTVMQYQLGDCGTVTHILANQKTNARPMDADWLFREYQSAEMPFKRFALGNHKAQGRLLTQQFTFNCGAPYKFIVDVESHPFDKSPPVVSRALEVIHDRVNLIHPEAQFNEVLNVGYFEKQKMDYHDDGEAGLGETVASISLGAPARMRFRVKARYTKDRHCWTTKPETSPNQSPNQSHIKEEPKGDDGLELGDDDEDEDPEHNEGVVGGQQPPSPPGRGPKKLSKCRVKLDLCLSHGDVMVMKGRDIQKYWEHSVIPQGLFRIAATARFISEDHPGMINKVKNEIEAENSPSKLWEKGQRLGEGQNLPYSSQDEVLPSLEGTLISRDISPLQKPAEEKRPRSILQTEILEETLALGTSGVSKPTEDVELAPAQAEIVDNPIHHLPQQEFTRLPFSCDETYLQAHQPGPSDPSRINSRPSPTIHQNASQNQEPWATGQESGNEPPLNFILDNSMPPITDRARNRVTNLEKYDRDTIASGLRLDHQPYGLGTIPASVQQTQPISYDGVNIARNPFSGSTPILPNLFGSTSFLSNQVLPRFGTQNILHSVDQPVDFGNIIPLPYHISQNFPISPLQALQAPIDLGDYFPEQLVPIMPNAVQTLYRIPGLTTLWPEIGRSGAQTGPVSEDSGEKSHT